MPFTSFRLTIKKQSNPLYHSHFESINNPIIFLFKKLLLLLLSLLPLMARKLSAHLFMDSLQGYIL